MRPKLIYKNLGNVLLEQRDQVLAWIANHGSNAEAVGTLPGATGIDR